MKKKVLIIIPNLGRGGAQQVFRQQLTYMSERFEVIGCVFNWDGSFDEDRVNNIVSLNVPGGKNYFDKAWYFILRIVRLRRLKIEKQIELSISHLEGADYINILSGGNSRTICWIHGSKSFDQNIKGFIGFLRKSILMPLLYKRVDKLVTVSKEISEELVKDYNVPSKKLEAIYNSFDLNAISGLQNDPLPKKYFQPNEYPLLITHCRLALQKNIKGLLYVMAEIVKAEKVKLVILGDGELREELISISKSLKLKTFSIWSTEEWSSECEVYFMGYTSNPYPFLKSASAFVMTSDWEGFPLALCEAMACNLPVVSADCPTGPREILAPNLLEEKRVSKAFHGQFGILMPLLNFKSPDLVTCWAETLLDLLRTSHVRNAYSIAGRERVAHFDRAESIKATINLIDQILVS